jgi:hypothetical protein
MGKKNKKNPEENIEKKIFAIMEAGDPKKQNTLNKALKAEELYISGIVNEIIISGRENEANTLKEFILAQGRVNKYDVAEYAYSTGVDGTLDLFISIYPPEKVKKMYFISQESDREKFNKLAPKLLKGFEYEFCPITR